MTPTEKDAMALAVLDNCCCILPMFAALDGLNYSRADLIEARAHLASRIAELEHLLTNAGVCELAARNVNVRSYMEEWEARANRAEAELAAVREAAGLNVLGMPVVENPKVPDGYAAIIQGGTVVGVIKVADATDAARGGE